MNLFEKTSPKFTTDPHTPPGLGLKGVLCGGGGGGRGSGTKKFVHQKWPTPKILVKGGGDLIQGS